MQLQHLILNNSDISRLADEGFKLRVDGNYLLVDRIPYLNPEKEIKFGTLVCALSLATPDKLSAASADHTLYFIGEKPCDSDGTPLKAINNSNQAILSPTITADHYLSSKLRQEGYIDHYEKISTYANIFCAQAKSVDPFVTPTPNKIKQDDKR